MKKTAGIITAIIIVQQLVPKQFEKDKESAYLNTSISNVEREVSINIHDIQMN